MPKSSADNYKFYESVVSPIRGWLHQGAAIRTMDMLDFQEEIGIGGPLLEIGVYCGRYLAILIRSAIRTNSRVVGVDLFSDPVRTTVEQTIQPMVRNSGATVVLIQSYSIELDPDILTTRLGGKARFISIDGSHERNDVFNDLCLAEQVIAPAGIVAVDDFINPGAFGVNEAVHLFFSQPRRMVPWAYVENKLFLCQPHWAQQYKDRLESIVMGDSIEQHSKHFQQYVGSARHVVEQRLWGASLLILSP